MSLKTRVMAAGNVALPSVHQRIKLHLTLTYKYINIKQFFLIAVIFYCKKKEKKCNDPKRLKGKIYIFTVKLQRFKKAKNIYKCYLKSNILKNPLGHIP